MLNVDKLEITQKLLDELANADVGNLLSIIMRIRREAISDCKFAIVDILQREVDLCRNVERNYSELWKKTRLSMEQKTGKNKFENLTREELVTFYTCATAEQIAARMTQIVRGWPHAESGPGGHPAEVIRKIMNELIEELRKLEEEK